MTSIVISGIFGLVGLCLTGLCFPLLLKRQTDHEKYHIALEEDNKAILRANLRILHAEAKELHKDGTVSTGIKESWYALYDRYKAKPKANGIVDSWHREMIEIGY